jgi:hypothetical protein
VRLPLCAFKVHPPLMMDLEAVRDDDHVVARYRERGLWGANCEIKLCRAALPRTHLPDAA